MPVNPLCVSCNQILFSIISVKLVVGCLKKLEKGMGEIQRMYVLPSFRGKGIGRAIVNRLIVETQSIGYRRLQLESMEFLEAAHYFFVRQSQSEPYCRFVNYLLCKTNTDI